MGKLSYITLYGELWSQAMAWQRSKSYGITGHWPADYKDQKALALSYDGQEYYEGQKAMTLCDIEQQILKIRIIISFLNSEFYVCQMKQNPI